MSANSRLAVAAHILAVLASREGQLVSSAEIASSVNTNPVVVRRILAELSRAGITESGKGKAGGSRLTRAACDVSLWDLAVALGEERLFAVHRNPANPRCRLSCGMKEALAEAFAGAEEAARERLRRTTVKDILGGIR